MTSTSITTEKATPCRLPRAEGLNDVWWPYVAGPEVGRHTNKVLGEQTEGRLFQLLLSYPRGAATPLHIHHDADETFCVLDGEVTVFVGEERYDCASRDFVLGPRSIPHAFVVRSAWAELLVTFSPAGIEGFFAEAALALRSGEAPPAPSMPDDPDEFIRLMAKYECEFVGPPPTLDD
jgi:quercetin dioxygenase-like cupin family protein